MPEVGRDGVEVQAEAVGGDHGGAGRRQSGAQGMDEGVRGVLGAWPEGERRDEFGAWVERQPEPGDPLARSEAGPDLVQLEVGQVEAVQEVPMHPFGVPGGPVAPAGDRRLAVAEDAHGGADGQPLGQGAEHLADAGRRRLEVGECGAPASADLGPAGLAAKLLDAVGAALVAVGDQGVDLASVMP